MHWFLISYPALVATVAAVFLVQHFFCMSAEAWAAWVAALGTLLAFAGTIWLATVEARRRRQQERDLALMVVAGLLTRIGVMEGRTRQAVAFIHNGFATDGQRFREIAQNLKEPGMWELEEVVHLVPLGGDLARDLAACRAELQRVIQNMEWMEHNWQTDPLPREERFIYPMVRICELLRRSHETCRKLNAEEN